MIDRPLYLDRLRRWRDKDVIKVVTGVRRCGKSTLLTLFADELRAEGVSPDRIITINLERLENEALLDYHRLHDEILSRIQPGVMNYVFIDEVQNVPEFQRAVDSLYTRRNIDLYITGSNALLLGGTLATLLSGRYVEITMQPLSFSEYISAIGEGLSLTRAYRRYISQGAFPATVEFGEDPLALYDYLEGILNTVLFKDVAQRLNISNTLALGALTTFLFDSIGNLVSTKRISDCLCAQGSKISSNTVGEYLSGLANSFVFYPVKRFDIRGKRLLKLQEKYYAVDMGMRRVALSNQVRDTGRILENVIFLELRRRYSEVYIGRVGDLEVDFVVNGPEPLYVQVAETAATEGTLGRELASLTAIRDNHPKLLLTLDDMDPQSHDGIIQQNALEWLMEA
ncbi:MAG: ATP-binding protein [Coriobacteriia bacterium]|nr:ATP-binding protein [Coriobacteriia bacterium]MBS5477119.1 ATP-binding protein [Coriobacteriia bacterium]